MKRILLSSFIILSTSLSAFAQNIVGVVDTRKVFENSSLAIEYSKVQKEIQDLQEAYKKKTLDNTKKLEEAKNKKVSEKDLAKMQEQFSKDLENDRKNADEIYEKKKIEFEKLTENFKIDLEKAIQDIAKEKQLHVVVEKQTVLFGGTDITEDVIKKLNKK
jgi:outer membrane protein